MSVTGVSSIEGIIARFMASIVWGKLSWAHQGLPKRGACHLCFLVHSLYDLFAIFLFLKYFSQSLLTAAFYLPVCFVDLIYSKWLNWITA